MHSNKNFNLPESVIKAAQQSMSAGVVALTKVEAELIEAKKQKLDPVGKEDSDVNNDGKVDKSDSYLKNRRMTIKTAMKEQAEERVASAAFKKLRDEEVALFTEKEVEDIKSRAERLG